MKALDLRTKYERYFTALEQPEIISIEGAKFITIRAKGSFTEKIFYRRIAALKEAVNIVINAFEKSDQAFELSVLEGLYWNDEKYGEHSISHVFDAGPLNELNYRLMIRVPDYVTVAHVTKAQKVLSSTHKEFSNEIEFFEYKEGKCVQMLHKGPFINELETLAKLEKFAADNNLRKGGIHHEIYLVDFTSGGSQEHLRTILREPVK